MPRVKSSEVLRAWVAAFFLALLLSQQCIASSTNADWSSDDAAHLLRRAGFGGTPTQVDAIHSLGKAAAVNYLLTGALPQGATLPFPAVELNSFKVDLPAKDADRKVQQQNERQQMQELRAWWVDRMVRTDRPLEEKMSLFWHGLFTSGMREVKSARLMADQNALFHRDALGSYRKLTHDIVHDGAMLRYLDAAQNVKGSPNENLARELMELFTMGEGNGYTEKDIAEVARALTGMAIAGRDGDVVFRKRQQDDGAKTILGKRGDFGPDDVVEIIFSRPEPAKYLARRLWEYFVYPNPTDADLAPIVRVIRESKYELKPVLRAIFTSDAFYGDKARFALIKSPVELVVGTARLLEDEPPARGLVVAIDRMGQQLLQPPNVRGWPGGEHWITTATLYTRYNAASAMVVGGTMGAATRNPKKPDAGDNDPKPNAAASAALPRQALPQQVTPDPNAADRAPRGRQGNQAPRNRPMQARVQPTSVAKLFPAIGNEAGVGQMVDAAAARLLQRPIVAEKREAVLSAVGDKPVRLGDKDSDQRVRTILTLLLSTPEYQLH